MLSGKEEEAGMESRMCSIGTWRIGEKVLLRWGEPNQDRLPWQNKVRY